MDRMMTPLRFAISAVALAAFAGTALAGTDIKVPSFSAITAQAGADVSVRFGTVQKVTVIKGDLKIGRVEVRDGQTLLISGCEGFCWGSHSLKVEVTVPKLDAVVAHSGASIAASGNFAKVTRLHVKATSGGDVDVLAIPADDVDAEASSGGDAKVSALHSLKARANSGGDITYRGHPPKIDAQTNSGGDISGE